MSAGDAVRDTLVAGLVGFDPVGAVVALAAIGVGARRRGITAFTVGFLVAMVVVGTGASLAVRVLSHTAWVRSTLGLAARHHLVGRAELGLGITLVATAAVLAVRSRLRHGTGHDPSSPRLLDRVADRLGSTPVLVGAGFVLAVHLLPDPGVALLAVTSRDWPGWWWPPAWLTWGALSQCLLLVLWAAMLPGRASTWPDRLSSAVRSALARSTAIAVVTLLVVGAYLTWDSLARL